MAIYYVSDSGNDSSGNGSSANPWRTPGKALQQCGAGDTIYLRSGTYSLNSTLIINKANTTWIAESGQTPIIDCGFSAARFTNTNEGPFKKKITTPDGFDAVRLAADGITLDGITVQNVPGTAIVSDGSNVTVRNCKVYFCYASCIKCNKTINKEDDDRERVTGLRLINNRCIMSSINAFDPDRKQFNNPDDQSVVGCIKVGNVAGDTLIQGNYLAFGYGEGLNFGKFNKGTTGVNVIEDNVVHDCNHTLLYINRSWDVIARRNVIFHTGDTPNRWSDGDVSTGLSVTDEAGPNDVKWKESWQESTRVRCYNNLVVNTSPLLRHAMQDDPNGVFVDIYFGFNTFVAGPEAGITVIGKNNTPVVQPVFTFGNGAADSNGVFENNVVDTGRATSTENFRAGSISSGFKFRNNTFTIQPPQSAAPMRGTGDQYGEIALQSPVHPRMTGSYPEFALSYAAAAASYGVTINPLNYKLTSASGKAIGKASNGSIFGGLTPPTEPRGVDFFRQTRDAEPDNGFHEYGPGGPTTLTANFTHVPAETALLTGTAVAFTDASTVSGTTITGWSWVIKKGNATQSTQTTQNINYTFGSAGTWTVALTITTASGETDTERRTFVISNDTGTPTATAAFTRAPSATTVEQGTSIRFTDTSLVTNTTQTGRTWEVRASTGGTLLASGTSATFDYQFNTAGTFTVKLAITTAAAVNDDETVTITVTATPPTVAAAFTLDDTTILEGETVTVATNTSTATNTTISGYVWTWGDGGTATSALPSHTYNQAGVYTVTLLVNTAANVTATATATVTVQAIVSGGEGNSVIVPHRAALNTTTGDQTVTVAALSTLIPKAMLVTMTAATADGAAAAGALLCVGATDGGRQWTNARFSANGLADSNTARRWTDDAVLLSIDGDGTVTGKASLVGFVPGGVKLNISDAFPAAYLAHFVFFAGDDVLAWVGTATGSAVDTARPVPTGIAQDAVIAVSTWSQDDTATAGADMSIGLATAARQYSFRTEDRDAQATAVTRVRHAPYLATTGSSDAGGYAALEAGAFSATGFTLTSRSAGMSGNTVCLLAFRSATGVYLTSAALGTGGTSTHVLPFETQTVLGVLSSATTPAAAVTGAAGETLGFYAGSIHGPAEYAASIAADHGATTTATRSLSENRFEAVMPDGTSLFDGVGAIGVGAFTATWSAAPAAAYLALLLAVEKGEEVVEPPAPPPVAAFTSDTQGGTVKFMVRFDASPSNPNGGGALTYLWEFGDGSTSTQVQPRKIYIKPGMYTVKLTVANANGVSTKTMPNYIVAVAESFPRYRVGPYLAADITESSTNDFPLSRPPDGAPDRAMWGGHSHRMAARYTKLEEMTAAEIAAIRPEPDRAIVCYEIDGHRIAIIESSGTRRYIATTT